MIEVEINSYAANRFNHDTLLGEAIVKALREAGIPVIAKVFALAGVQKGTLTMWNEDDLDGEKLFFRWAEDEVDRKQGKPSLQKLSVGWVRKWARHQDAPVVVEDDEL
jgi:hypothetical protein